MIFLKIEMSSFTAWLKNHMFINDELRGLPWSIVFPYLCHEIWKDKNNRVFQYIGPSPTSCLIS